MVSERGAEAWETTRKVLLKDPVTYGPWKAKLTSILDAEDCWEIVSGEEHAPVLIESRVIERVVMNQGEVEESRHVLKILIRGERRLHHSLLKHLVTAESVSAYL